MVQSYIAAALALTATAALVRADATPTDPGPGSSFTAGKECTFNWDADTDSTTAWKSMTVELMSGSNQAMNHITTVATDLDGTQKGTFSWTCPEVAPYSTIYFYQFSSCDAPDKTWTTRFTITSASGETTDPENATQDDGSAIPWGTGALVDTASSVAAPTCDGSAASSGAASGSASATDSASATAGGSATTGGSSSMVTLTSSASQDAATNTALNNVASSGEATGTSDAQSATPSNGALALESRVWQAATALGASALAFVFVL
ncbi:hypothetical protein BD626DRAFT_410147 [Schizophyllum amplum]|uniref:Yeast cell wall synthesis Kre9/Knh1-like N-terminal domain-containing protein n=1 Tax=Schizophyllum amplum TaxID=97359 RepID=A0A550C215_9AGAR|nr:hypothetical protein BD626DRAFT_410147 [Auriculariopsis ampla]